MALGAVAVGVLGAVGIDSERGKDTLAGLEDVAWDAAEACAVGLVVGRAEDVCEGTGSVACVIAVQAANTGTAGVLDAVRNVEIRSNNASVA